MQLGNIKNKYEHTGLIKGHMQFYYMWFIIRLHLSPLNKVIKACFVEPVEVNTQPTQRN